MKRIAIILPEFLPVPAVKGGGVETLVTQLLLENEKRGKYRFDVYSIAEPRAEKESKKFQFSRFFYYDNASTQGSDFILRVIRKLLHQTFVFNRQYFKRIITDVSARNYDAVIVENKTVILGMLNKMVSNDTSLIVHIHNRDQIRPNRLIDFRTQLESVFAVSKYVKNEVLQEYPGLNPDSIQVVHNFVDSAQFDAVSDQKFRLRFREKNNISDDEKVILYSGRVIESKGIMQLIRAVAKLDNKHVYLVVVGNSWYGSTGKTKFQSTLEQAASVMPNKVIFTGYIEHDEISKYYAVADICVFPSIAPETAGLVQLEAMASGKMTVVSSSGGMPEYISKEGFVVPLGARFQEELFKTLNKLVTIPNSSLAELAHTFKDNANLFSVEKSFDELVESIDR